MKLVAYAARAWRISTWRTTGVWPITSPPLTAATLQPDQFEADVIYIRLHGLNGQPFMYGDPGYFTALSIEQMRGFQLPGSLVFLEGCYGAEFAQAFLSAGARAAVGNSNPTWGKRWFLGPAERIGKRWIKLLKLGYSVEVALAAATAVVRPPHSLGWSLMGQREATL